MANQSIYNAFERLWQHILLAIDEKTQNIEEIANQYIWKEYSGEPTGSEEPYTLVEEENRLMIAQNHLTMPSLSFNEVLYSTEITVENGIVWLTNPTTIIFEDIKEANLSDTNVLKGKYIQIIRPSSMSDTYFIPESATITSNSQMGSFYDYGIKAPYYRVVPNAMFLGYRVSVNQFEYPKNAISETTGYYYTGGNRIGDVLCGDGSYSISVSDKQEIAQSAASIVDTNLLTLIGNEVS